MIDSVQTSSPQPPAHHLDADIARTKVLAVNRTDIAYALLTCGFSLAVIGGGMFDIFDFRAVMSLHIASLGIPGWLLIQRGVQGGELTVPALLLVATLI